MLSCLDVDLFSLDGSQTLGAVQALLCWCGVTACEMIPHLRINRCLVRTKSISRNEQLVALKVVETGMEMFHSAALVQTNGRDSYDFAAR